MAQIIYRIADEYGRQVGYAWTSFRAAHAKLSQGLHIDIYDRKSAQWVRATCGIYVENVGVHFGCIARLIAAGGEVVASTDTLGFGFDETAKSAARDLAKKLGIELRKEDQCRSI